MTTPYKLFFIAHVDGGENVDLFVAASDVGAATHHWRRYFGRTDQPATIWEVPQGPFLKSGPLGWRTSIMPAAQVGPVIH